MPESECWTSITSLPDDVSLNTYHRHRAIFDKAWENWAAWVGAVVTLQEIRENSEYSSIAHVACDVSDHLQASIYNILVGYYRLGLGALRNVLEQMAIGTALAFSGDKRALEEWLEGSRELKFGWAADKLMTQDSIGRMEDELTRTTGDDLFGQKQPKTPAGLARRMFAELSSYVHGGPAFSDADIWRSNGPVYVEQAVLNWSQMYRKVLLFATLMVKLVEPRSNVLESDPGASVRTFYTGVLEGLDVESDGYHIFETAPKILW